MEAVSLFQGLEGSPAPFSFLPLGRRGKATLIKRGVLI